MCEGCVDICPWKCIHMLDAGTVAESINTEQPGDDPDDHVIFVVDEDVCTRCGLCVDRCPTGVIIMGKAGVAPREGDAHQRDNKHGFALRDAVLGMAKRMSLKDRLPKAPKPAEMLDYVQGSQLWNSIFRPGSIFRKGYTDSPRNRSYVIMNSVLYHLHPVKVKRHAVKVSYTLCLGGLSFFLFIMLTVTGIFLMFFYRPTAAQAWNDIKTLQTSVTFGLLVRNMHRWGAHLMVISVFLHMARGLLPRGLQAAPGVQLGHRHHLVDAHPAAVLHRLPAAVGPAGPLGRDRGDEHDGLHAGVRPQVRFVLLGGVEIGTDTLLRWYVLHVLMFPFVIVIFMAIHFWRVRKDGGISGPL